MLLSLDGKRLLAQPDPLLAATRAIGSATAAQRPFTATVRRMPPRREAVLGIGEEASALGVGRRRGAR